MHYSAQLIEKCRRVSTANIGHLTHFGFMDVGIRPVYAGARLAGPARTVQLPGFDGSVLRVALERIQAGDVVVVDRLGDSRFACWGDVMAFRARAAGAVGAVIDGAATDPVELQELGFPTFSRSISPLTTTRYGIAGRVDVDVSCGGAVVHPGDLVIGDANGVVVLSPDEAERLVDEALTIEERARESIRRGEVPPMRSHGTAETPP
jgi:regulator of RNase E activity RraA